MAANGGVAWAWLGDMELDDTLLGLGAADVFGGRGPLALGFLVNNVHCAKKPQEEGGSVRATAMLQEKRTFLKTFFGDRFFTVLDRNRGNDSRGWVGRMTASQQEDFENSVGFKDQLEDWIAAVAAASPSVLHLLVSGPLLGRGPELFTALREKILSTSAPGRPLPRIIFWIYSGQFNLAHTSEGDRESLKKLVEDHSPRVKVIEATLKMGAWLSKPPRTFWGSACPTAWSLEEAKANPIGFDVSTDIQSANAFLKEYSSPHSGSRRGIEWIFQRIAEDTGSAPVSQLLQELEVSSMETNLGLVNPTNPSLAKVREALAVQEEELQSAFAQAKSCLEKYRSLSAEKQDDAAVAVNYRDLKEEAIAAASAYAMLYKGSGDFLECGCTEYFPPGKPRLDKRAILRCMAQGKLNGGPTADVLLVLGLLLYRDAVSSMDSAVVESSFSEASGIPKDTQDLFQLVPSEECKDAFTITLLPSVPLNDDTKRALAPLIDAVIDAVRRGAKLLQEAGPTAAWGCER